MQFHLLKLDKISDIHMLYIYDVCAWTPVLPGKQRAWAMKEKPWVRQPSEPEYAGIYFKGWNVGQMWQSFLQWRLRK